MSRTSATPPNVPASLDDERRCVGCGYLLRGLGTAERCPECGWPIAASRGVRHPPAWLRRLAAGLALDLVATSIGLFLTLVHLLGWLFDRSLISSRFDEEWWIRTLIYAGGYVVHVWGVWMISTPTVVDRADGNIPRAAWILRGLATATATLGIAGAVVVMSDRLLWTAAQLLYASLRIGVAVAWWRYVRRLALRVGRDDLAGLCTVLLWVETLTLTAGGLAPWLAWLTIGWRLFWPGPVSWIYCLAAMGAIGLDLKFRGVLLRDAAAGTARLAAATPR